MTKESERFVAFGFVKDGVNKDAPIVKVGEKVITIEGKDPYEKLDFIRKKRDELRDSGKDKAFDEALQDIADHEWLEISRNQVMLSDYPNPVNRYYISLESWNNSIEPYYFWCINFLGEIGFPIVDKITDVFTAAEHSSFYGAAGQRLGLAQDKVGQYMATIGKMIKDLFQLVRELRWIDERLEHYCKAFGEDKDGNKIKVSLEDQRSADLVLKGLWVDLVDGVVSGQRTGSNLFTMAQQVQFTVLPDLFFNTYIKEGDDIGKFVETQYKDAYNPIVRNTLSRKLQSYYAWRRSTFSEIKNRRTFTLKYLNQHYQVIRMYIQWVKPYIKHIERLTGNTDILDNPRIISAFETSMIEIEVLARMRPEGNQKHFVCILLHFEYTTKPSMQYPGDGGYHRGPVHVGSTRITWRSYAWSDEQIKAYKQMREKQDLELLSSIDNSLISAMEALGDDLMDYLAEAQQTHLEKKEAPEEEAKLPGMLDPLASVGRGAKEVFGVDWKKIVKGVFPPAKASGPSPPISEARKLCWTHYNIFKKAHGLLAW